LTALAPLHQPQALRLIRAVQHLRPTLAQTASFDTAFHSTQSDLVRRFALPRALHDQGIKRYGFHGLSYAFIAAELGRRVPKIAAGKVIVAHLGSGASLCALDGGESRDCSMGFSTLDGIPMATRCGALDPGVLLHLLGPKGRTLRNLEDMLYHRSGLLGVSGISADTRDLLKDERPEAREAIDLFTLRIAGEIGRMTATLGGLDGIVFTAGIGEHQPEIRAAICERLRWLGVALDGKANTTNEPIISTSASSVATFVIATDEEQTIANEALSVLAAE
jgi:acetate kinase